MSHPPDPSYAEPRPVETSLGTVWLTDEGDGPLVIAIAGLPGSHRDFRWMAPRVRRYARFVRLDMPGFGLTPLRSGIRPRAAWRADLVAAVADSLQVPRFAAIAHSMSGPVLASLAARYRDRITAAGFISCGGSRPHRAWRQMPISPPTASGLLASPRLRPWLMPVTRAAFRAAGLPTHVTDATLTTALHCAAATDFAEVRRDLARIEAPCLVAASEDDPLIEPTLADEIAAAVPEGPRLRFPDGGHGIHKAYADELAAAFAPLATRRSTASRPARDTDRRAATREPTPG